VTKSARTPCGGIEFAHFLPTGIQDWRNHHLCNPVPSPQDERLPSTILENHFDFTAVISVDGSRSIREGNAVAVGQSTARADLRLGSRRKRHGKARRDQDDFSWLDDEFRIDCGA